MWLWGAYLSFNHMQTRVKVRRQVLDGVFIHHQVGAGWGSRLSCAATYTHRWETRYHCTDWEGECTKLVCFTWSYNVTVTRYLCMNTGHQLSGWELISLGQHGSNKLIIPRATESGGTFRYLFMLEIIWPGLHKRSYNLQICPDISFAKWQKAA